ncbi:MAG: retention module-containing protein, partial [Pseudomonadales bacterium]|nr:retention module-containing protein [Pseudomonadales bacterium]
MATIGTVSYIQGRVVAEDAAGNQRTLTIGDDVLDTEQIITSAGARIEIDMVTGDNVVVANGQSWSPTAEAFTNVQDFSATDATLSPEDLALQEALLAGADPTQLGEATAAGAPAAGAGTFGGADGGGSSFVRTARTGESVDPSAGYDTIGTAASLVGPSVDPQLFAVQELVVGLDSVFALIKVDQTSVEEGSILTYTISLVDENGVAVIVPAGRDVEISLSWSGDAANALDADPLPTLIVISGASEISFSVNVIDDAIAENPERLVATITEVNDANETFENLVIGAENETNTIITDEAIDPDSVFAIISVDKRSAEEGESLTYTVSLVDGNGDAVIVPADVSITVNLQWAGPAANDLDAKPRLEFVTISGGSSVDFIVDAVDDVYDEELEALETTITSVVDGDSYFEAVAVGAQNFATSNITDESEDPDPVYAEISVDKDAVEEGGQLTYTVKLVDENGNTVEVPVGESITVDLVWSGEANNPNDAAPLPTSVTISGSSEYSFVVDAIDDVFKENPEDLVVTITKVTDAGVVFEDINIGAKNTAEVEITDESDGDVVYAKISVDTNNAEEGDTIGYTVTLVDKDGN